MEALSRIPTLGAPVVIFFPSHLGVSLLKLNSRRKGARIFKGILGNQVFEAQGASQVGYRGINNRTTPVRGLTVL